VPLDDKNLIERTRRTAKRLFDGPVQVELPHQLWKEFDPGLAKDLSLFVTGKLSFDIEH
jgi:4-carboxymuconolactone decarboxylase